MHGSTYYGDGAHLRDLATVMREVLGPQDGETTSVGTTRNGGDAQPPD